MEASSEAAARRQQQPTREQPVDGESDDEVENEGEFFLRPDEMQQKKSCVSEKEQWCGRVIQEFSLFVVRRCGGHRNGRKRSCA